MKTKTVAYAIQLPNKTTLTDMVLPKRTEARVYIFKFGLAL